MRSRHLQLLSLGLLAAAVLPLAGDAAVPEPVPAASKAACCNAADAPPPPVSSGDERFFTIPSGVPNVMILFDNSGSMENELPRTSGTTFPIEYPGTMPAQGTCSLAATSPLEILSSRQTATPYDAGYKTWYDAARTSLALDDSPPWTTACSSTSNPTDDRVDDGCLFRASGYYKFYGETPVGMDRDSAMVFNATPALDSSGLPTENKGPCAAIGSSAGDLDGTTAELAAYYKTCMDCLRDKGYYLFDPPSAGRQMVLSGKLMNVFPDNPLVKKALTARKIVKNLVKFDPLNPNPQVDVIRFGLASTYGTDAADTLGSSIRGLDGARLMVPLGPDCDASTLGTQTKYVEARQAIIDALNNAGSGYIDFGSWTPLGESLFNVGQYFARAGTSSEYRSRFSTNWLKRSGTDPSQNFEETSRGQMNAPWVTSTANQKSFCFGCQQSSVILVTDGKPTTDNNLPRPSPPPSHDAFNNDFRNWVKADGSFTTNCANCSTETLHKVASFLNTADLRTESTMSGSQSVRTYAVSFGLGSLTDTTTSTDNKNAIRLLNKTAELGGSTQAYITNSDAELRDALETVVADVQERITSFSSTNATSLQTSKSTSADAYLGRFKPQSASTWEGHLYAGQIFDEFGEGCSEAFTTANQKKSKCGVDDEDTNPNLDGDEILNPDGTSTGLARCQSAYLVDKECDPVIEDDTGFKKGDFNDVTHVLASSGSKAKMHWDAGAALSEPDDPDVVANGSYRSAAAVEVNGRKPRQIYTVIDKNADGSLTVADGTVEFRPENAAALAPMMNLPALGQTSATALPTASAGAASPWCNVWLDRIGVCGRSPLPSCGNTAALVQAKCAKQVIQFFRGWDVDDQDGDMCSGPDGWYNTNPWGTCTTDDQCKKNSQQIATCVVVGSGRQCRNGPSYCTGGEERDRSNDSRTNVEDREMWKLGDIFHSSPVLVRPPFSKSFCNSGAFNQCVLTLYSALGSNKSAVTKLEQVGTKDAYDLWREDWIDRDQFVVVGANDGMFHAFDAGKAIALTETPLEGFRYDSGTGAELWAFIPPDLLPRLRYGVENHTTYVDGNPMVRDVWVDGTGSHPADGTKQKGEFHTIAIITERGGGQRFTALDITDPTKPPTFLWTYPQPCSEDSKLFGQSWSDFLPRPPPIGPVRLALPSDSDRDPLGRGYEERWVAVLNGGYDPALVRGRLVVMVDVWTGRPVWRFGDAELKAVRDDTKASMFPVAAAVAMVDIGEAKEASAKDPDTDGYFDTATWGDLGGNLYTARFHEPGAVDAGTGLVTNWWAARSFEQNRKTDDTQQAAGRGQFFFMTANLLDGPARLISLLGSGDRENLMQKSNTCGARDVLGCCASGCTAGSSESTSKYGTASCNQGGTFSCTGGIMTFTQDAPAGCSSAFTCGPVTAPAANQETTLDFTCGGAGNLVTSSTHAFDASGVVTASTPFPSTAEIGTGALGRPVPQYRMFGVWSYGAAESRLFKDEPGAKEFDKNRFTDVAYTGCKDTTGGSCTLIETSGAAVKTTALGLETVCPVTGVPCQAESASDPGWMYSYGKVCPLETCDPPAPWADERSANGVNVMRMCSDFSTMRPDVSTGASVVTTNPCDPNNNLPVEFSYLLDAKKGVPRKGCGVEDTTPSLAYRAGRTKSTMAPPQAGSTRIVVNEKGQVSYSTLKMEAGSTPEKTDLGRRNSLSDVIYWLEVPRALHECRHGDGKNCK